MQRLMIRVSNTQCVNPNLSGGTAEKEVLFPFSMATKAEELYERLNEDDLKNRGYTCTNISIVYAEVHGG